MTEVFSAELCGQISPAHEKLPLVKPFESCAWAQSLSKSLLLVLQEVLGRFWVPWPLSQWAQPGMAVPGDGRGVWHMAVQLLLLFFAFFLIDNSCHLFPSHPSAVLSHSQSPAPVPPLSSGWVPQGYCQELVDTRGSWVLRCCWQRYNSRSAQAGLSQQHFTGLRCFSLCCFNCNSLNKLQWFFLFRKNKIKKKKQTLCSVKWAQLLLWGGVLLNLSPLLGFMTALWLSGISQSSRNTEAAWIGWFFFLF